MRARVLRGRLRTSTVLLVLVFLLTLATYLLVRPMPTSVVGEPDRARLGRLAAYSVAGVPAVLTGRDRPCRCM